MLVIRRWPKRRLKELRLLLFGTTRNLEGKRREGEKANDRASRIDHQVTQSLARGDRRIGLAAASSAEPASRDCVPNWRREGRQRIARLRWPPRTRGPGAHPRPEPGPFCNGKRDAHLSPHHSRDTKDRHAGDAETGREATTNQNSSTGAKQWLSTWQQARLRRSCST